MNLELIDRNSDRNGEALTETDIRKSSSRWSEVEWSQYLSLFETDQSVEEILVGSSLELERYVAKNSEFGAVPSSSVDQNVKLKNQM